MDPMTALMMVRGIKEAGIADLDTRILAEMRHLAAAADCDLATRASVAARVASNISDLSAQRHALSVAIHALEEVRSLLGARTAG